MARRTVGLPGVPGVVELDAETPQRRERLHICRGVADRADGVLIVRELLHMARRARRVARHLRRRAVVRPHVAKQARHAPMLRTVVQES